jgi:ribonucleoside-diphosphate reductase alpha chain
MTEYGPKTKFSDQLHAKKYRGSGESFKEAMNRIAGKLTPSENFKPFREILLDMRFMPGGRIQSAIGSTRRVTPYNCFVSGTIEDTMTSGHSSIMQRAMEAAETMRMGGGIGYDFSTLRPRGDKIKKLGSFSFWSCFIHGYL